jgi:hypothetical protein
MDLSTEAAEGWGGFRDLLLLGFGAVLGAAPGNDGNVGLGMEEKCKALVIMVILSEISLLI